MRRRLLFPTPGFFPPMFAAALLQHDAAAGLHTLRTEAKTGTDSQDLQHVRQRRRIKRKKRHLQLKACFVNRPDPGQIMPYKSGAR